MEPSQTIRRVSPEYIFGVARLSIVSVELGSRVITVVPSDEELRRMTHQPAVRVAAAVNVCVMLAVMSMTLPLSPAARIVFVERDSFEVRPEPIEVR